MRVAAASGTQLGEPVVVDTPPAWEDARATLANLFAQAAAGAAPEAVLGGVAGVVRDSTLVWASRNMPGWEGADIAGAIRAMYPDARIVVENDAAVACLGEAHEGAGKGHNIVAYLTVGTGVGGACVADGVLEPRSAGYEPGNDIIDYAAGATVESIASGRAIAEHYGVRISQAPEEAQEQVARALAVAAHNAVAYWSPSVVVMGGGVMHNEAGLFARIERHYQALPAIVPQMPPLMVGSLGDTAGLVGALML